MKVALKTNQSINQSNTNTSLFQNHPWSLVWDICYPLLGTISDEMGYKKFLVFSYFSYVKINAMHTSFIFKCSEKFEEP